VDLCRERRRTTPLLGVRWGRRQLRVHRITLSGAERRTAHSTQQDQPIHANHPTPYRARAPCVPLLRVARGQQRSLTSPAAEYPQVHTSAGRSLDHRPIFQAGPVGSTPHRPPHELKLSAQTVQLSSPSNTDVWRELSPPRPVRAQVLYPSVRAESIHPGQPVTSIQPSTALRRRERRFESCRGTP
jgi:hypothetical protein